VLQQPQVLPAEKVPVITFAPPPHPSVIYGEPVVVAPAQQRVIIDEP